jgi:hypothetical protein
MTIAMQRFGKHRLKGGIAANGGASPLLENGSIARVSAATDILVKVKALPRIDTHSRDNGNNRGTVWDCDVYSSRLEVKKSCNSVVREFNVCEWSVTVEEKTLVVQ